MDAEHINALSTAVIAFVTVIAATIGFYYNLKQTETITQNIIIVELIFIISVMIFVRWVRRKGEIEKC